MKRKPNCLIKEIHSENDSFLPEFNTKRTKMPSVKEWLTRLQNAEKTSVTQKKIQKVHYKFSDNSEMVEEYNLDTFVVMRRAWKKRGQLGGDGKWAIEVGEPESEICNPLEVDNLLRESNDQPILTRRNTRVNLEWRVRNLPYPIETYSVAANSNDRSIIVKTTNKKYYKKLDIPELDRIGIAPVQANVEYTYKFNTLIVTYKKPKELLDLEKLWLIELKQIKNTEDGFGDCKPS